MASLNQYDEMQNFNQELGQIQPSFLGNYPDSVGSPGSGGSPPYTNGPVYTDTQYNEYPYCYPSVPTDQVFFPPNFNPADYYSQQWDHQPTQETQNMAFGNDGFYANQVQPFSLQPVPEVNSTLKKRRASRSKCPCVKCCQAKGAGKPSPSTHACIFIGCSKTYTRPAHLKAHLKTHQAEITTKCQLCRKTVLSDQLVAHMLRHGEQMKLR